MLIIQVSLILNTMISLPSVALDRVGVVLDKLAHFVWHDGGVALSKAYVCDFLLSSVVSANSASLWCATAPAVWQAHLVPALYSPLPTRLASVSGEKTRK